MPAGLVSGLPVGITLVGKRNQDGLLLQVARGFERATSARVPPHLVVGRTVAMRTVRLLVCVGLCAAPPLLAADYTLLATPETVAWGYYSGRRSRC